VRSVLGPLPLSTLVGAGAYELAVHALDLAPAGARAPSTTLLSAGVAALVDTTGALAARCDISAGAACLSPEGGWAFAATGLGAIGFVATIFTGLYPRVLVSDPVFANSLTISNAAAGHYALQVITVVAAIFTPIVLLYQGWTYHVFRKRLSGHAPG